MFTVDLIIEFIYVYVYMFMRLLFIDLNDNELFFVHVYFLYANIKR